MKKLILLFIGVLFISCQNAPIPTEQSPVPTDYNAWDLNDK